eukprot:TRINITY_DN15667_c0_g1_i1.p1 TRINITY_DN15667_c0_g1~~TRINITY_DN15667_c0_g1_i1.p1  ORF type:complete len:656 (+),score=93.27 TRINITY_DN15667_c0_g1_i1:77-1969(+)
MASFGEPPETVYSALQKAKPRWSCEELCKVHSKLQKVNIRDVDALGKAIADGCINSLLAAAGERRFKASTLQQISYVTRPLKHRQLSEPVLPRHQPDSQESRCLCGGCLRGVTCCMEATTAQTGQFVPGGFVSSDAATAERARRRALLKTSTPPSVPTPPLPHSSSLREAGERITDVGGSYGSDGRGASVGFSMSAATLHTPQRSMATLPSAPCGDINPVVGFRAAADSELSLGKDRHSNISTRSNSERGLHGNCGSARQPSTALAVEAVGGARIRGKYDRHEGIPQSKQRTQSCSVVPLAEGGMRRNDDALEELLRKARGSVHSGKLPVAALSETGTCDDRELNGVETRLGAGSSPIGRPPQNGLIRAEASVAAAELLPGELVGELSDQMEDDLLDADCMVRANASSSRCSSRAPSDVGKILDGLRGGSRWHPGSKLKDEAIASIDDADEKLHPPAAVDGNDLGRDDSDGAGGGGPLPHHNERSSSKDSGSLPWHPASNFDAHSREVDDSVEHSEVALREMEDSPRVPRRQVPGVSFNFDEDCDRSNRGGVRFRQGRCSKEPSKGRALYVPIRNLEGTPIYVPAASIAGRRSAELQKSKQDRRMRLLRSYNSGVSKNVASSAPSLLFEA